MPIWSADRGEVAIKVAVVGQSGSGKGTILRELAAAHSQASVRTVHLSDADVVRTEFIWPEPLPDGPFVRVNVYALTGLPKHQAIEQLVLTQSDAVVFVADCNPTYISESRNRLLEVMKNFGHAKLDWEKAVIVLQYHRADLYPGFKPEELDQWLGLQDNRVARFVTSAQAGNEPGVAVNHAVGQVIDKLIQASEVKAG